VSPPPPRHLAQAEQERHPYDGRHLAPRRTALSSSLEAVMLGLAVLVTAMALGLNSLGVSRAPRADRRPAATSSSLLASRGFADVGVEQWRAFPGTFLTKGRLGVSTAPYARVQRDPASTAVTDPLTDAAMVGMASHVLTSAVRGTSVRATVRVRGSRPGIRVLVRLSEPVAGGRAWGAEGRLLLLDATSWHEVAATYRARGDAAPIDLEVWASGLNPEDALYVDRAKVTSP
jgi:hypothetical protein